MVSELHPGEATLHITAAVASGGDGEVMEKQSIDFGKVLEEIQESLVVLNLKQGETQAAVAKLDQGMTNW